MSCFGLFLLGMLSFFSFSAPALGAVGDITISVPDCVANGDTFTSEIKVDVGDTVLGSYYCNVHFQQGCSANSDGRGRDDIGIFRAPPFMAISPLPTGTVKFR